MDDKTPEDAPATDKKSRKFDIEKLKSGTKKFALAGGLLVAGIALGRATADKSVEVEIVDESDES